MLICWGAFPITYIYLALLKVCRKHREAEVFNGINLKNKIIILFVN